MTEGQSDHIGKLLLNPDGEIVVDSDDLPILRAMGLRHKISLGPWFRPAFGLLVAMRPVRGTAFDPFGRAEVRRVERALVEEYATLVESLVERFDQLDAEVVVQIAGLPDLVRGYEQIKLASVERYHQQLAELTERLDPAVAAPLLSAAR